jgi:uncharacterized protein YjbI with pentapeptide repeats
MVDPVHLRFLRTASFDDIRRWHEANPDIPLDLSGADLSRAVFDGAPLGMVDFCLADLSHAKFNGADLSGAAFTRANATDAQFVGASLIRADFIRADLAGADFREANLTGASLDRSNLRQADLSGADLSNTDLFEVNFSGAKLTGANLSGARCGGTIFANLDLSEAKGLEAIEHLYVSTLGLDTLQLSKGKISRIFLQGCGIPDSLIDSLRGKKYRIGESIGPWLLRERLGAGGNGEVWKADCDGWVVALKILRSRDPKGEAYARFRSEIDVLRKLQRHKGILPLLDASLPDSPSRDSPAWLAMPPAIPTTNLLSKDTWSLQRAVQAIAAISKTLASLHSMKIAHRDIKPDNLFWYEEKWVVGDFGLVAYPDKRALTKPGRKVGPLYYMAPEMMLHPEKADGRPADVFSLAKTLWVLATGQNYPPQGPQRVDSGTTINRFVPHPRARLLDEIVHEATQDEPEKRPTMSQIAVDLRRWLKAV